jgi:hypothetical protein
MPQVIATVLQSINYQSQHVTPSSPQEQMQHARRRKGHDLLAGMFYLVHQFDGMVYQH